MVEIKKMGIGELMKCSKEQLINLIRNIEFEYRAEIEQLKKRIEFLENYIKK